MNSFLKFFIRFTIIAVMILSGVTVYQYMTTTEVPEQRPPVVPMEQKDDLVQQAIIDTSDIRQFVTSGNVKIPLSDFMNAGKTFQDPANPGNYILSGDLGYCLGGDVCLDNSVSDAFTVWFDGRDGVLYVSILAQPMILVRDEVENYLGDTLGLDPEELCDLNYYMGVPAWVDSAYAGQHVLFSQCS